MLLFSNCSAFRQVQFETITRTQHQPRALALVPTNQKSRVCRYQRFESNAEASVNQLEQLNAKVAWCGHVDFLICARDIKRIWFSWKLLVYHYFWVAQLNAGCFVDSCMSSFLHFQETQLSSFSSPTRSLCPPWNVLFQVDMKNQISSLTLGSPHTGSQGHGDHPWPPKSEEFVNPSRFLARHHPHSQNQCLELLEEILCHSAIVPPTGAQTQCV
jgi:hypothetical protein